MSRAKSARASGQAKFVSQPKIILTDTETGHIQVGETARFLTRQALGLSAGTRFSAAAADSVVTLPFSATNR